VSRLTVPGWQSPYNGIVTLGGAGADLAANRGFLASPDSLPMTRTPIGRQSATITSLANQVRAFRDAFTGWFGPGTPIRFQAANAQGSQDWVFTVGETEAVDLPDGPQTGIRLSREHSAQYDTKVEVWLAPSLSYLPVRIRLSQTNGDFAELLWRSTRKPD
jgi:hypothetical protein